MSELHKFLFDGLPVRGQLVRLTDSWRELLSRRGDAPLAPPVRDLLGELTAAAVLMQSNLKFDGGLVLQAQGDGPLKLAVAEVGADLCFRATATVIGEIATDAGLQSLLNAHGQGRCAITLDPERRARGQQPYQGVVSLSADGHASQTVAEMLEHYMRQSEQLDSRLVLAADTNLAAGLLLQRMPAQGSANLGEREESSADDDFRRLSLLAATLTREELLTLDADTVLHRLFWQEPPRRLLTLHPRFACRCSRQRVTAMLRGLGRDEVEGIVAEQGQVDIGCEFCGEQYRFDAIDAAAVFAGAGPQPPGSERVN